MGRSNKRKYEDTCEELIAATEYSIRSKKIPEESGLYAIVEEYKTVPSKWLYVGKSNDMKRRIGEHRTRKRQAIDKKIARTALKKLSVKFVYLDDPGRHERRYIDCLRDKGYDLPLSLIHI